MEDTRFRITINFGNNAISFDESHSNTLYYLEKFRQQEICDFNGNKTLVNMKLAQTITVKEIS